MITVFRNVNCSLLFLHLFTLGNLRITLYLFFEQKLTGLAMIPVPLLLNFNQYWIKNVILVLVKNKLMDCHLLDGIRYTSI